MSSRTIWKDRDGDEIELSQFNYDGKLSDHMYLDHKGTTVFAFNPDDARSFAERLLAFAREAGE